MVCAIQRTLLPGNRNFLRSDFVTYRKSSISLRFFERLSARVCVKRSRSSVLTVLSHASRGACCHCQYPQSRNDQRVPTRVGSAILTESILFDDPSRRDISKALKVYRRGSVRDDDAMIESLCVKTRRAWLPVEIVFYEIEIIAGTRGHSIGTVHFEKIDRFIR